MESNKRKKLLHVNIKELVRMQGNTINNNNLSAEETRARIDEAILLAIKAAEEYCKGITVAKSSTNKNITPKATLFPTSEVGKDKLEAGIWIYNSALLKEGGTIAVKVKYNADGSLSELLDSNNKPVDTKLLDSAGLNDAMRYITAVKNDLDKLRNENSDIKQRIEYLANKQDSDITIGPATIDADFPTGENRTQRNILDSQIKFNPFNYNYRETGGQRDPSVGLAHELLGHAYNNATHSYHPAKDEIDNIPIEELEAIYWENVARAASNEEQRVSWTDWDKAKATYRVPDKYLYYPLKKTKINSKLHH